VTVTIDGEALSHPAAEKHSVCFSQTPYTGEALAGVFFLG
jgi:hypothetical protein